MYDDDDSDGDDDDDVDGDEYKFIQDGNSSGPVVVIVMIQCNSVHNDIMCIEAKENESGRVNEDGYNSFGLI